MKSKTLNTKSTAKNMNEYFVKYEHKDQMDGVVVKAKTATQAVALVEKEFEPPEFRLVDVRNLTNPKVEEKKS